MDDLKFAVVIVTYNRKELLKECIQNVLRQTAGFHKIIIIDNASTDGTKEELTLYQDMENVRIIRETENMGGACGFHNGLKAALQYEWDWVLLIDDDAILSPDYMEQLKNNIIMRDGNIGAYTGTVMTQGRIAGEHRAVNRWKRLYQTTMVGEAAYKGDSFPLDYASFCGLLIKRSIVELIGLPEKELFIRCDDFEYSLRIRRHTQIVNINAAVLNHKTRIAGGKDMSWKLYYAIRNAVYIAGKYYGSIAKAEISIRYLLGMCKNCMLYGIIKRQKPAVRIAQTYINAIIDGNRGILGIDQRYTKETEI